MSLEDHIRDIVRKEVAEAIAKLTAQDELVRLPGPLEFREAIMWRAAERESCRGETWAAVYRERREGAITRALAFRAAARQP